VLALGRDHNQPCVVLARGATGTPAAGVQHRRGIWPEGKVRGGVRGLARCEYRG
jgi:hypothetical protein